MKKSQTIEIWKKFLKEARSMEEEVLEEEEPFQKAVKKGYLKKRDQYLTTGPQKAGPPFSKKPKNSRAKSAPPAGLPVAEEKSLDESFKDFMKRIFSTEKTKDQAAGREEPMPDLDIDQVNIPIPYPEDQKDNILKDPQVRKLLNAYISTLGLNHTGNMVAQTLVKYPSQVDSILQDFMKTARVVNVAQKADESPESSSTEVSIENELIPTFKSEFNKSYYANKDKYEDVFNSVLGKKIVSKTPPEIGVDDFVSLAKEKGLDDKEVSILRDLMGKKTVVKENLSITNVSGADLAELIQNINKFYPYAQEYLKFDRPVSLNLVSDPKNAKDTFGKTAYYNPSSDEITIFVDKRHPKDMIRSFSHELVHHAQNCRGEFDKDFVAGENYIEENDHLNLMEREAYEKGNMCLRYYESYLKKENKKMSLNEETLRKAIREAIKRVTENKTTVAEEATTITATMTEDSGEEETWHQWKNEHADDDHIKEIEHHLRALKSDRDYERDEAEYDHDKYEDEGMEEGKDAAEELGDDVDREKGLPSVTTPGKEDYMGEDKAYTAKKEKRGDKRKGAEKRGGEGTLAKTKGHGRVDYVNEEEALEEGEDWGANEDDYKRKKDKAGVRKKTGDVGGGKYGKGGHYKDYEKNESQETPLHEKINREKGQLIFDKLVNKWCK